jgi:hypothetical protein
MVVRFFGGYDFSPADGNTRTPPPSAMPGACRWAAI